MARLATRGWASVFQGTAALLEFITQKDYTYSMFGRG